MKNTTNNTIIINQPTMNLYEILEAVLAGQVPTIGRVTAPRGIAYHNGNAPRYLLERMRAGGIICRLADRLECHQDADGSYSKPLFFGTGDTKPKGRKGDVQNRFAKYGIVPNWKVISDLTVAGVRFGDIVGGDRNDRIGQKFDTILRNLVEIELVGGERVHAAISMANKSFLMDTFATAPGGKLVMEQGEVVIAFIAGSYPELVLLPKESLLYKVADLFEKRLQTCTGCGFVKPEGFKRGDIAIKRGDVVIDRNGRVMVVLKAEKNAYAFVDAYYIFTAPFNTLKDKTAMKCCQTITQKDYVVHLPAAATNVSMDWVRLMLGWYAGYSPEDGIFPEGTSFEERPISMKMLEGLLATLGDEECELRIAMNSCPREYIGATENGHAFLKIRHVTREGGVDRYSVKVYSEIIGRGDARDKLPVDGSFTAEELFQMRPMIWVIKNAKRQTLKFVTGLHPEEAQGKRSHDVTGMVAKIGTKNAFVKIK